MSDGEKVRASRDGDRFHYHWAARRSLHLLDLNGTLEVVSVEGLPAGHEVEGEEVIDVAEYHGGRDPDSSSDLVYTQLKHSTLRVDEPVVASELRTTLTKFARIYRDGVQRGRAAKMRFSFVTNRALNEKVRCCLAELAVGATAFTHCGEAELLRRYLAFDDRAQEADFCRRFGVDDAVPGLAGTEALLHAELRQYLPGGTGSGMTHLVDEVARRATTLAGGRPFHRSDVLLALRTSEDELFPAPSAIERPYRVITTGDVHRVVDALRGGAATKLLLTAVGGIGKSVLTTVLGGALPEGSVLVAYDCFAGGDYRKVTSRRHDHRTALTQIANELAAGGWCIPLVPTDAEAHFYMRAFTRRVEAAAERLERERPEALLVIVIDAADNAAMAAAERQQRTVVADLLREDWPANVRLVPLCRPERLSLLDVPTTGVTRIELHGFRQPETLQHLRTWFPDATEQDGAELHALSGGNPRVQAMATQNADTVAAALIAIRIAGDAAGGVLDGLLAEQVRGVAKHGHLRPDELDRLAEAMATLHPVIPLDDLAAIAEVPVDAIRSFAVALGRGLHTTATTVQFRDEPTETWFRTAYAPSPVRLREFVAALTPLAAGSSYVAAELPQLLFEAGMYDELVELALSDVALPGDAEELRVREIARARARFALGAMLLRGRNADAALLAVQAGALSSGHSRTMAMLRSDPDLAARFLDAEAVEALCSGRELTTDWPGSNLHVEAVLLSHVDPLKDLARTRIRSAVDNFAAILALPEEEPPFLHRQVTAEAVADLALAAVNLDGPDAGIELLSRFGPDEFVHIITARLAARLADAGRDDDLVGLVLAGDSSPAVRAAVATTMFDCNIMPSADATAVLVTALVAALDEPETPFRWATVPVEQDLDVRAVVWTLVHAVRHGQLSEADALRLLDVHVPQNLPDGVGGRSYGLSPTSLLLAHALRARLVGARLTVEVVASGALLELMRHDHTDDHNARDFRDNIPGLLPWAECWVAALLTGGSDQVVDDLASLVAADLQPITDYRTPFVRYNGSAEIATRILSIVPRADLTDRFAGWHGSHHATLSRSCLTVARVAARAPHLEALALDMVTRAVDAAQLDRTDADTRIETLIDLARSLLAANATEARSIFDLARAEADRVGDDLHARWHALTVVAKALATDDEPARAYRLFQIGERLDRDGGSGVGDLGRRLLRMHGPTYFSALSRARDRRTLDFSGMVTAAVEGASGPATERLGLLALHAFGPMITWQRTVTGLTPAAASLATRVLRDFTRCDRAPGEVPAENDTGGLASRWRRDDPPLDPASRFADSDFTTDEAWDAALPQLGWRREEGGALMRFALDRHLTRRADVLAAFSRALRPTETHFTLAAQTAAAARPQTPALRDARRRLATELTHRFAHSIGTRYDDDCLVPFAEATGTTVADLGRAALQELGQSAHRLTYREYFLLAANLAGTLDPGPAGAVFDALAALFEDLVPSATSSDGPFQELPDASGDQASGVAGVIWGALGDMSITMRWQAANAVLLLVRLGCTAELQALARLADGTSSSAPFRDARLPFYALHARMWLLLALARAVYDPAAAPLAVFAPWLAGVVRGPQHAAHQVLAQRALAALAARGLVALDPPDTAVLTQRVVAETVELDHVERRSRPDPLPLGDGERERYPFFIDFEQYWCRDVAEAFGSTETGVARRAHQMAAELDGTGLFADGVDPRSTEHVYDAQRSYPDRSGWPDQDSHSFYLAVHALLTVGAELADTVRAYHEPGYVSGSYSRWLARFLPTRSDGRWLADRRDAPPSPAPEKVLADHEPEEHWPWSLRPDDFEAAVGVGDEWITVDASTSVSHADLSQDLRIQSALVPHRTARSLLVASQTSPLGPATFPLPTTDDDHDRPDRHPFEITPWLNYSTDLSGIDGHDERGAGIEYPPTRPRSDLISQFDLTTDDDHRTWSHRGTPVLESRVWRNLVEHRRDRETGTRGDSLAVRLEFMTTVLRELDRTLVLQVLLRRDRRRTYRGYRQGDDDDFRWLEWSGKTYLLDPTGRWREY